MGERFPTADGLAKLVPISPVPPAELPDDDWPLVLITGRLLEHWHTGAMSRRSEVLETLEPAPKVWLAEDDLTRIGITVGEKVEVATRRGMVVARVQVDPGLPRGAVFMPFCWAEAAANLLTHAALDPQSKIPEYKYCAARVGRLTAAPLSNAAD